MPGRKNRTSCRGKRPSFVRVKELVGAKKPVKPADRLAVENEDDDDDDYDCLVWNGIVSYCMVKLEWLTG